MLLLAGLVCLFFLSLLLPVDVRIYYCHAQTEEELTLGFRFLRFFATRFHLPLSHVGKSPDNAGLTVRIPDETIESSLPRIEGVKWPDWDEAVRTLHQFRWVVELLYVFLRGEPVPPHRYLTVPLWGVVTAAAVAVAKDCCRFRWVTELGTEDAAKTAVLSGLLWAVKGTGIALIEPVIKFRRPPVIQVQPCFRRQVFSTCLDCIFRVHVGHIIIIGIRNLIRVGIAKGVRAVGR